MSAPTNFTFDLPLLQAVSDWQRGSKDRATALQLGLALKAACANLPQSFRECHLVCYRRIALDKRGVMNLLGVDNLREKVSSWTVNTEVAKGMKGGVPFPDSGNIGAIFYTRTVPDAANIIVNVRALYQDQSFCDAMHRNQANITNFDLGAGSYWDGEDEVVLEIDTLTQSDLYSLGGYSSPFEELVKKAARELYGRPDPTPDQYQALLWKVEHLRGHVDGAAWLNEEATRRVLNRVEPHAQVLYAIKQAQDLVRAGGGG